MKIKKNILVIFIVALVLLFVLKSKATASSISYTIGTATVNRVNSYNSLIDAAASIYSIPAQRIKAHITVESVGNPDATGSIGEVGLMQMTQGALTDVNNKYFSFSPFTLSDLKKPEIAITTGTAYLKILYDQTGDLDQASKAYNVGIDGLTSKKVKADEYFTKITIAESKF